MPGPPATIWDSQESREAERHSRCRGCRSTSGMRAMCRLDSGTTGSDRWGEPSRTSRTAALSALLSCRRLHEKPRRYRNQLRMPDQRMRKDATDGPLVRRDVVRRPSQLVKRRVIHSLYRLLDPVVLEVVLAAELHPRLVIRRQAALARITGADSVRGGAAGQAPRLHGVRDPAPGEWIDHVRRIARDQHAIGVGLLDRRVHDDAAHGIAGACSTGEAAGHP